MMKKDSDVELGSQEDKAPLIEDGKEPAKPPPAEKEQAADMKDAAFWLFMLFLASVTMTVGNKVRWKILL